MPILMCSDDIDFSCTLIMVDVRSDTEFVYWERFGLENSGVETTAGGIGSSVHWFADIQPLTFARAQYEDVLEKFWRNLDESKPEFYEPDDDEVVTTTTS